MDYQKLQDHLGQTDIYLLDQFQKGWLSPHYHILDCGCGTGRNLQLFLSLQYNYIYGSDINPLAVQQTLELKNRYHEHLPNGHFITAPTDKMPFRSDSMDVILSIAVLHFAKDDQHFKNMLDEMWRVLKPGGMFFCRLASSIGIEKRIEHLEGRHYLLPDGTKRFLADETFLLRHTHRLGASFLEPIKTVNVQNTRCMTTWVLQKR